MSRGVDRAQKQRNSKKRPQPGSTKFADATMRLGERMGMSEKNPRAQTAPKGSREEAAGREVVRKRLKMQAEAKRKRAKAKK